MGFYDEKDLERASLYRLFSTLFMHEPTDEILIHIKELFEVKFNDTVYEIRMDFTQLFLDPVGRLLPYESLYNYSLGDKPRLWGKTTEEVQKFYQSVGITIDEEIDLIPDHLSAELIFMSYLIEHSLIESQKSFLENHLLLWIPEYCEEIKKYAQTTFYKKVVELLKGFILDDYEEFGIRE